MVLEVPLAVIAVTTAVKDIVEVGQKIHGSFAKVSDNYVNARRVAEDIKEMVEEVEVFCEDHKDALDGMKDFNIALQGLLGKFRNFEKSVLPSLPQTGGGKRVRFIRGWDAWRNNNKVERSISDLQSDILRVMRRYVWKSALRTEVKLENIRQETSRGLTGITQGLEVLEDVLRDMSTLRITASATATHGLYESPGTTSDEFTSHIIMFAQSTPPTSVPMLRTPDAISEELVTIGYIKFQINSIAMSVEKMSKSPASTSNNIAPTINTSTAVIKFQITLALEQAAMSTVRLRHWVVRQVTIIRDRLDTARMGTVSIDEAAKAVSDLKFGLQALNMNHECILVGDWAIMLARSCVAATDGDENAEPCASLALYLLGQSIQYHGVDDDTRSLQTIMEAYAITQRLYNENEGDVDIEILYGCVLLQYSELVDAQRSIEMLVDAIHVLEDILDVDIFSLLESLDIISVEQIVQASPSFLDRLFDPTPSPIAITKYALALQRLGARSVKAGHPDLAVGLELLAIAVRRKMVSVHGDEHKLALATALLSLVKSETASQICGEELVDMADESVNLFRDLAGRNPVFHARQLICVLGTKATILEGLNRDTEAIVTREEVASLAGQLSQDSKLRAAVLDALGDHFRRLRRYDDAVRTQMLAINAYQHGAEIQAMQYFHLSTDLQQLQRYKESAQAARTSVALYRRQAMKEPETWTSLLTKGLSNLAHCLAASGDYSEALIAWKESVYMIDNFVNANKHAISGVPEQYLDSLRIHTSISFALEDEEQCLKVCFTAVRHLRQLSELFSQDADVLLQLWWTDFYYADNLLRFGRPQDAQQYVDRCIDSWQRKKNLEVIILIPESDYVVQHVAMIHLLASVLDTQGFTEQALLTTQKVQNIIRLLATASQPYHSEKIETMILEVQIRIELGNNEEALQIAEEALQLSQDNKLEADVGNLLWTLLGVASASWSCCNYKRALETAQEGCNILMTPDGSEYCRDKEYVSVICPRFFALLAFAEANLGRYRTALEYAYRAVDLALDIGKMKLYVSATTAEWSYMETRGYLADILVASRDISQALQICQERRAYFIKRVERRMGEYRELAPILRMLGILCCSERRHEEGDNAAKELSRIIDMLGKAFPSLQTQVKRRLRHQVKVPILEALNDMNHKLECGHQAGILSLFEEYINDD